MITILVAKNEARLKDLLIPLLRREGYDVSGGPGSGGEVIKISGKGIGREIDKLKNDVIELEDSIFKEKRGMIYKTILDAIEKPLIERALEKTEGNQLKAARILGINRNTIRSKIKRLNIDVSTWKV